MSKKEKEQALELQQKGLVIKVSGLCLEYMKMRNKTRYHCIPPQLMDIFVKFGLIADGPFIQEPQIQDGIPLIGIKKLGWGTLSNGEIVVCELESKSEDKVQEVLESSEIITNDGAN